MVMKIKDNFKSFGLLIALSINFGCAIYQNFPHDYDGIIFSDFESFAKMDTVGIKYESDIIPRNTDVFFGID